MLNHTSAALMTQLPALGKLVVLGFEEKLSR